VWQNGDSAIVEYAFIGWHNVDIPRGRINISQRWNRPHRARCVHQGGTHVAGHQDPALLYIKHLQKQLQGGCSGRDGYTMSPSHHASYVLFESRNNRSLGDLTTGDDLVSGVGFLGSQIGP
jgi:hypothetical protein